MYTRHILYQYGSQFLGMCVRMNIKTNQSMKRKYIKSKSDMVNEEHFHNTLFETFELIDFRFA